MSFEALHFVRGFTVKNPVTKFVLSVIAIRTFNDSGLCRASQKNLMLDTELSRSSISRHIKKLVKLKILTVHKHGGSGFGREHDTYEINHFLEWLPSYKEVVNGHRQLMRQEAAERSNAYASEEYIDWVPEDDIAANVSTEQRGGQCSNPEGGNVSLLTHTYKDIGTSKQVQEAPFQVKKLPSVSEVKAVAKCKQRHSSSVDNDAATPYTTHSAEDACLDPWANDEDWGNDPFLNRTSEDELLDEVLQ